jgi:ABC-type nitrate/sulfonate/bicarbonate transport system permease component
MENDATETLARLGLSYLLIRVISNVGGVILGCGVLALAVINPHYGAIAMIVLLAIIPLCLLWAAVIVIRALLGR